MCGIFGVAGLRPEQRARADAALNTLSHRGPDQFNAWLTPAEAVTSGETPVYLGHRRLSIMDLSENGRQPMFSADKQHVLTVNGEIYNYPALKRELEGLGYVFCSGSDSEALLHGYAAWGWDALLDKLDGMFALVLLDRAKQRLHLAVDHAGIKPLYLAQLADGQWAWASELKAIAAFAGPQLTPNAGALFDFLFYRYIPAPKTLYTQVQRLPAAHAATLDLTTGRLHQKRYWHMPTRVNHNLTLHSAAEQVRTLIQEAVRSQLMSDVPLGFFLSGGMDSSILAQAAVTSGTPEVRTLTIGFGVEQAHDEARYAEQVAAFLGTRHTTQRFTHSALQKPATLHAQLRAWYDEPFGDTSAFPTAQVCAAARQFCTVALSGDGGDELFGGYQHYHQASWLTGGAWAGPLAPFSGLLGSLRMRFGQNLLSRVAAMTDRLAHPDPLARLMRVGGAIRAPQIAAWRHELGLPRDYDPYWALRRHWRPDLPPRTRLQYLDFHTYLPDDVLTKVDRVSMQVALEVRVPLLAKPLCEWASSVPDHIRYHNGQLKGLLRYAYRNLLPEVILQRGKQGFSLGTVQTAHDPRLRLQEDMLRHAFKPELDQIHA